VVVVFTVRLVGVVVLLICAVVVFVIIFAFSPDFTVLSLDLAELSFPAAHCSVETFLHVVRSTPTWAYEGISLLGLHLDKLHEVTDTLGVGAALLTGVGVVVAGSVGGTRDGDSAPSAVAERVFCLSLAVVSFFTVDVGKTVTITILDGTYFVMMTFLDVVQTSGQCVGVVITGVTVHLQVSSYRTQVDLGIGHTTEQQSGNENFHVAKFVEKL